MLPNLHSLSDEISSWDNKDFIASTLTRRVLELYKKALDDLNERSAQMGEILRAMEDKKQPYSDD
jgi:hypothetical protein